MHLEADLISPMTKMDITLVLGSAKRSSSASKMDISTVLNRPDELEEHQSMAMDIASWPSTANPLELSPNSIPLRCKSQDSTPQMIRCTHRLPSMGNTRIHPTDFQSRSDTRLPPLRSLFQNISPSCNVATEEFSYPVTEISYRSKLDFEMMRHETRDMHVLRRKSYPSCWSFSNAPIAKHYRMVRRRSHPQAAWSTPVFSAHESHRYRQPVVFFNEQEPRDHHFSPPTAKSKRWKGSHNNKAYTQEQVMWIRYYKVDRGMKFNDMLPLFFEQFPDRWDPLTSPQATGQMLSSRYYRDNDRPWLDKNRNWKLDSKGRIKLIKASVRQQKTAEGKELCFPMTMVDKWPAKLLQYDWKLGILEEHKERARQILAGNDPTDPDGKKAGWRRILNECIDYIFKAGN